MRNKLVLVFIFGLFILTAKAQQVVTFEELNLSPNSYWNGSDNSGNFISKYLKFYNNYNDSYQSWMGWAYSNTTDTITNAYSNMYSAAGFKGNGESENYAIAYMGFDWAANYDPIPSVIKIDKQQAPTTIHGAFLCLSTWQSKYIDDNNLFENNNYWAKIEITAIETNNNQSQTKEFIIADYRFTNESNYKMNTWTYIDLSWIGAADSLNFILKTNDSGDYGPNFPSYICIDDIGASVPNTISPLVTEVKTDYYINLGDSVELLALVKGGIQPYKYTWSNSESLIANNLRSVIARPTATTTYQLTIEDAIGRNSIHNITVHIDNTKLSENIINAEINTYIDNAGNLIIENFSNIKLKHIKLYDINAKEIFSSNIENKTAKFSTANLKQGLYFISLISDTEKITKKIIIYN